MACVQRMIKSGIRLYKPQCIFFNFPPSAINRLSPSPIPYRSFCSSSSDDDRFILSEGKRYYYIDTIAMVKGLEAQGIPPKHAEAITSSMVGVLDELDKDPKRRFDLLQKKADSLRKNIKKMRRDSAEEDAVAQYSSLNLPRRVLEKRANLSAKITTKRTNQLDKERMKLEAKVRTNQLDEERMKLEAKESEGTFHVFLSLCIATVGASLIGMTAALVILFNQIYKS